MMVNTPDFGRSFKSARKIIRIDQCVKEGAETSPIQDGSDQMEESTASGDIEFHGVWFRYPTADDEMWVLRDFNLKIKAGESIGLVGESGCGKSTLTALLYRFYEPQIGFITIGGKPINSFTLKSLRERFGFVQQEPLLFNTSIMENIIYGKREATAPQILDAAKISNCSDFIANKEFEGDMRDSTTDESAEEDPRYNELPEGYKIMCGSRGNKLSGGQKQRVAIARAVIRNPQLLILDEATSALDENSQKIVQEALDQVMLKCTSIVIAHRQSTLKNCDRIVKIEQGVIVEDRRK